MLRALILKLGNMQGQMSNVSRKHGNHKKELL